MRQWIEDILAVVFMLAFVYGTTFLAFMLEPIAN